MKKNTTSSDYSIFRGHKPKEWAKGWGQSLVDAMNTKDKSKLEKQQEQSERPPLHKGEVRKP